MLRASSHVTVDEVEGSEPSMTLPKDVSLPDDTSMIHSLPDEVLVKVFSYLSVEELAWRVPFVCRRWEVVSEDSEIWRSKIYKPSASTPCSRIAYCLQRAPKLEGICISRFSSPDIVRSICKSIVLYTKNLKYLSLPVDVNRSFPIKNVLIERRNSLLVLDLRFYEDLIISDFLEVYAAEILTCVGMCTYLQSFTLSGIISCDEIAFKAIADGCMNLRSLNVQNCDFSEPKNLEFLLKREVDTITSLSLSWNFQGDQGTLPLVAKYCQKLEKLCIIEPEKMFGYQVTCHDVAALRHMTHLRELSMPYVKDDVMKDFLALFESGLFKNLRKLDFSYNPWVKNVLLNSIIKQCSNLKILQLQCCYDVTSIAFQYVYLLKYLERLNLEGCVGLRDEAIFHIAKCKTLRYLNVNRIFVFSRHSLLCCCEQLKYLQELHIIVQHVYEEDLNKVPQQLLLFLRCKNGSIKQMGTRTF